MWILSEVRAENLCSFKQMLYHPVLDKATLVCGKNMDNDSQGSNGSGKSALLEAIAIGLVGNPLRKVKIDEIINDAEDEMVVYIRLFNDFNQQFLEIKRVFRRNQPQEISIKHQGKEIAQSSVLEYNQYILDTLGITKEYLYSYFLLSKHKFTPFLSSSDKEKKEIINSLTSANQLSGAVDALSVDVDEKKAQLSEAEKKAEFARGKCEAYNQQIEDAINNTEKEKIQKTQRLEQFKLQLEEEISACNGLKEDMLKHNDLLSSVLQTDKEINELVESAENIEKLAAIVGDYDNVQEKYDASVQSLSRDYKKLSSLYDEICPVYNRVCKNYELHKSEYEKHVTEAKKKQGALDIEKKEIADKIFELHQQLRQLNKQIDICNNMMLEFSKKKSHIKAVLSGAIQCPSCSHQFILKSDKSVRELEDEEQEIQQKIDKLQDEQDKLNSQKEDIITKGKQARQQEEDIQEQKDSIQHSLDDMKDQMVKVSMEKDKIERELEQCKRDKDKVQDQISRLVHNVFVSAADKIADKIVELNAKKRSIDTNISNREGIISSIEESISKLQESTEDHYIKNLRSMADCAEQELETCNKEVQLIKEQLSPLLEQQSRFLEFQTYLANTKIEALAQSTNQFLEEIGSDIRIALSGYKVLKSGKIREKISISIIRDGVDCGSFDKFSEGEKVRVNLANILALHKLVNSNCGDGKGLDLLVLDEILEATDEEGLSNMFEALNKLKVTSLIVSHGNVAENYPNKVVICKSNGISSINETTNQ